MTEESCQERLDLVYDRVMSPAQDRNLYHYCNASTYLAILQSDSIRFSDVNMMNDAAETRYSYSVFIKAANAALATAKDNHALVGFDTDFLEIVDAHLGPRQAANHPVIACFSKKPDVLSQWRGYADDSKGFAIGFDARALAAMPVTLLDVLYDEHKQVEELRNTLVALYLAYEDANKDLSGGIGLKLALLGSYLHAYKHSSFAEEQEVRALHELAVVRTKGGLQLLDEGGTVNGATVPGQPVNYRASGSGIVAYIDLPLQQFEGCSIREIWMGPSNGNGPGNVVYPLTRHGHHNVELRWSASSYRSAG